jgi:apolipoprotein N-acyltransferase
MSDFGEGDKEAKNMVYPLAATALEFLFTSVNLSGTWLALGYTQYGNLPLMQLASLTGIWGIGFLISWFGSVVNWVWERDFDWKAIKRGVLIYASILIVVMAYGGVRLAFSQSPDSTVRIASMTAVELIAEAGTPSEVILDRYFDWTIREAQAGAKVIVWSEAAADIEKDSEDALVARGQQIAEKEGIYLVLPIFMNRPVKPTCFSGGI